jgi:hypothetical protein
MCLCASECPLKFDFRSCHCAVDSDFGSGISWRSTEYSHLVQLSCAKRLALTTGLMTDIAWRNASTSMDESASIITAANHFAATDSGKALTCWATHCQTLNLRGRVAPT